MMNMDVEQVAELLPYIVVAAGVVSAVMVWWVEYRLPEIINKHAKEPDHEAYAVELAAIREARRVGDSRRAKKAHDRR